MDFLSKIFSGQGFMPHGHSYLWSPEILWFQLIGDLLMGLAYFSISVGIYLWVRERKDLEKRSLFLLFGAFMLACGISHAIDILTIWIPVYRLEAIMTLSTGIISIAAALSLFRILPRLLKIPTAANDTSKQSQPQQDTAKLSHRLETIMAMSPSIIYLYDLEEQQNVYSNRSVETLLGYSEDEIKQKGDLFAETVHPEDLSKVVEHHAKVLPFLKEESSSTIEYRMQEKDSDQYRWFRSQARVFERSTEGEVKTIIGIASDITQEKASGIAALRKVNDSLQQAQKELEHFVYAVSHDLRAPVRHILGYTEMMKSNVNDPNPEPANYYPDKVLKSATRLDNMISGLLQYSKNQNTAVHKKEISLMEMAREVQEDFNIQLNAQDRKVNWEIADLPIIFADKEPIRQVLENIIGNALKYSAAQEISEIKIWSEEIEGLKWIHISDNGVGFNMAYADKLFKLFQRLHTRQEFPGTGLGLASAQKVISRHGGKIKATAVEGEGAVFSFCLPNN